MSDGIKYLVGFFAGLVAMSVVWTVESAAGEDSAYLMNASAEEMSSRHYAAAKMVELGAANWIALCAYQKGLDRAERAKMVDACTLDWGLGEPRL